MLKSLVAFVLAIIVYAVLPSSLHPTNLIPPLGDFINSFGLLSLFFGWLAAAFLNLLIIFILIRVVFEVRR
jgi:hypothetical protein